jgi:hypothetical protein
MIEFYPDIRWVHICAVIASGSLFALRGAGVLSGARWPMWAPLRYLTYTIDTVLLTAALMLVTILHQYPFVQAWLTVKLLLLGVHRPRHVRAQARADAAGARDILRRRARRVPVHCERRARPPSARDIQRRLMRGQIPALPSASISCRSVSASAG